MTVIEFAHVKLLPGTSISSDALRNSMQKVKQVIEAYNNLPTNFIVENEDSSIMYVIGSWESMSQHANGFSGSPAQNEILSLVQNQMTIDWQHYIDLEYTKIPMTTPVVSIATYGLQSGDEQAKEDFRKVFAEPSQEFINAVITAPGLKGSAGGWNISKPGEELLLWVQFSGWDTEANAKSFYASPECRALMEAAERLGVESAVRHGSIYDLN